MLSSDSSLDSEDEYCSGTVVKTSVTNNSLFKDYLHPDDHARQTDISPVLSFQC